MDALIEVTLNEDDEQIVSGRTLHKFLEVKTLYKDWIKRKLEYGFTENEDYILVAQKRATNNPKNPETEITDHALKLDMAKEICMLEKNEKGKQARQYFIKVEKEWNSPDKIMARALKIASQEINMLRLENTQKEQIIGELKPKADYLDSILQSKSLVTVTQIAKDYGMSGKKFNSILHGLKIQYKQSGQWLLYSEHQAKGYTSSETINISRTDGRTDTKMNTKWTQKGRLFLYEELKKKGILPLIEKEELFAS